MYKAMSEHWMSNLVVDLVPENDTLQVEGVLDDPGCGDSNPKHILLSREIGRFRYTVQIT